MELKNEKVEKTELIKYKSEHMSFWDVKTHWCLRHECEGFRTEARDLNISGSGPGVEEGFPCLLAGGVLFPASHSSGSGWSFPLEGPITTVIYP